MWLCFVTLKIEFKLDEFVDSPSLEIFDMCSLEVIADHYEVAIVKHAKKNTMKVVLYASLVNKGILPRVQSAPKQSGRSVDEAVRLKELEVE